MTWPLVSRRAFDLVCAERDRVLEQNAGLIDSLTRIQRAGAGLPELPAQPRKGKERVPADIVAHIRDRWSTGAAKKAALSDVAARYGQTKDWDVVRGELGIPRPDDDP